MIEDQYGLSRLCVLSTDHKIVFPPNMQEPVTTVNPVVMSFSFAMPATPLKERPVTLIQHWVGLGYFDSMM